MKWCAFLVVVCITMTVFSSSAGCVESEKPVVITSIFHSKKSAVGESEAITFTLQRSVVPKIFILRGEKPRLVVDFPLSIYQGNNTIALSDGNLASAIRIGLHKTPTLKTRVVIDLSKEIPVTYADQYSEEGKTLVVKLIPGSTGPEVKNTPAVQIQSPLQKNLPSREELSAKPLDERPVPGVFAVKNEAVKPVVPMILGISVDNSSGKKEMVFFRLNGFYPPTVSAIEKDTPRLVCDFMAVNLQADIEKTILTHGKYIERIRTAKHQDPDKVRVTLDLAPDRDYDLQQVFFRKDNLFVLIVNELPPKQTTK